MPSPDPSAVPPADWPAAAATLEMLGDAAGGPVCAVLTPAIKARLRDLAPGQILRVRVDDPSARVDVPAWCALTGHTLLGVREGAGGVLDFAIRKEPK